VVIAVALDWGLIFPVVKNADIKISWASAHASTILPERARFPKNATGRSPGRNIFHYQSPASSADFRPFRASPAQRRHLGLGPSKSARWSQRFHRHPLHVPDSRLTTTAFGGWRGPAHQFRHKVKETRRIGPSRWCKADHQLAYLAAISDHIERRAGRNSRAFLFELGTNGIDHVCPKPTGFRSDS